MTSDRGYFRERTFCNCPFGDENVKNKGSIKIIVEFNSTERNISDRVYVKLFFGKVSGRREVTPSSGMTRRFFVHSASLEVTVSTGSVAVHYVNVEGNNLGGPCFRCHLSRQHV